MTRRKRKLGRTSTDNWGRPYDTGRFRVETVYCDLATRQLVTVYESISEEIKPYAQLAAGGFEYGARGVDKDGRTVVSRGRRAWCPTLDHTERSSRK